VVQAAAAVASTDTTLTEAQKIFYLHLNATELNNATKAVSEQTTLLEVKGTPPLPATAPAQAVAGTGAVEREQPRSTSGDEVQRRVTEYQREVKESTPAVIDNLRSQPLLIWGEQQSRLSFDLSDSGIGQ
jgi:hypothetical protein